MVSFVLVDVNGVARALDDTTGVHVAAGARGLGTPPVAVNGDKLPYAPGAALRRISTPASVLEIPLYIEAATSALLDARLDTVRAWLMPGTERNATPSKVIFRVTRDDGAEREIEGVYAGGLEGDDLTGVEVWQDAIVSLFCPDPYWRDTSATTHEFTSGSGLTTWWPYYEHQFMPSAVFAEETIALGGHVEVWPVWTITGPGSNPILTNLTTGEVLAIEELELDAGDTVTIDTSERAKTVVDQNGVNLWPYVPLSSAMWPLEPGSNEIRVQMANTTVASAVELAYRRRWAGGHR